MLRMIFGWLEQTGCIRPPFTLKSTCPVRGYCPYNPELVCIISTKLASSLVSRNSSVVNVSINGLAGSKPVNNEYYIALKLSLNKLLYILNNETSLINNCYT